MDEILKITEKYDEAFIKEGLGSVEALKHVRKSGRGAPTLVPDQSAPEPRISMAITISIHSDYGPLLRK
jgi:hypothetical protein